MEGTVSLRHRKLLIEFQTDRHAQERIHLAYQRLETLASVNADPKFAEMPALSLVLPVVPIRSENQG